VLSGYVLTGPSRPNTSKKDRSERRAPSVAETLKGYDNQLEVISKFDEKIIKFEELLKKMKSDLYGSVEFVADKINETTAGIDPPKRGIPKIVSDIQLVPPRPIPERAVESQEDPEPYSDLETWTEVAGRRSKRKANCCWGQSRGAAWHRDQFNRC